MTNKYDDIINLSRHVSKKRTPMTIKDRAAQFSPFAALTGYEAEVKETARLTENRIELDQDMERLLNQRLQILLGKIKEEAKVKITYFKADDRKDGGSYIDITGIVEKIDVYEKNIFMNDGMIIPINEIIRLEGDMFEEMVLASYDWTV